MKKPKFIADTRNNGHNEFREFITRIPEKDRRKLLATISNIQELGIQEASKMEQVKKIDDELFEIRSKVSSNIQRAVYFHAYNNEYIITHGFTKKTQKTPHSQIIHGKELRLEYFENERKM